MKPATRIDSPASTGNASLNPDALNQLLGQMVSDLGAAVNGSEEDTAPQTKTTTPKNLII
jgi:hypothetical protein